VLAGACVGFEFLGPPLFVLVSRAVVCFLLFVFPVLFSEIHSLRELFVVKFPSPGFS
jgi:hypothetical protein